MTTERESERQSFPVFEESDFWLDISAVTMFDRHLASITFFFFV
jgi:hypothetical protein